MNFNQIYKKVAYIATGCTSIGIAIFFFLVIISKKRMLKKVLTLYISKNKV